MLVKMKIILFVILVSLKCVVCGNILFISLLPSPSHHIWNKALSMGLIEKGHNVTMLSPETEKEHTPNFTVITTEGMYDRMQESFKVEEYVEMANSVLLSIVGMYDFVKFICEVNVNTKGLEALLNYPNDFKVDLIIYDVTFGQCLYPIIERFDNPPVVAVTAFLLPPVLSHAFGNHLYTSYMPFYSTEFTTKMTISERILNFIYTYAEVYYRYFIGTNLEFQIAKQRFGDNIRPLEELERNMTLLLANTDPVLNHPIALPPNIIPVGGLHARPARALPEDLKKIMDNAKHGIILFSLGTNVRSSDLKPEQKQAFLNTFAKLPQIILWKFELDDLEGLPKNVIIRKWLPQNDILGHPNTKLFISHGGALSTQEAMYHGVPVIGIPFLADQFINIQQMKVKGIAEHLNIQKQLVVDEVYEKIEKMLNSDKYRENVRKISKLYRDQPQTALERAIFWTEYVMRHGSGEHLVLAARDMPSYQTANIDVLAVFVLAIVLIYYLLMLIYTGCRLIITMRHYNAKPRHTK